MKRRFGHWRKARQDSNLFLSLMQLATRYLRGAGRVQKACVIPSGIYVISLRMRIGNHTGQKELFLILQETISLRVSNKLIRIARKSFLVLCNQEVYPKKGSNPIQTQPFGRWDIDNSVSEYCSQTHRSKFRRQCPRSSMG